MPRSLRRPPAAMVVACLALFVALAGTSYATVLNVPRNSVGAPHLRSNAVTAPKIRANAISSPKVRNRSLLAVDFAAGQLPPGPAGPAGPTGPAGPAGPPGGSGAAGYEVIRVQTASNSTTTRQISADCPSGKRAVGGSVRLFGFTAEVAITATSAEGPATAPDSWFGAAREVGAGTAANWGLRVDVICMQVG